MRVYGFGLKEGHPWMVHDPVTDTELMGLDRPLRLERMFVTKIKPTQIFRMDKDRSQFLEVPWLMVRIQQSANMIRGH